jgi:hypothetical protein
MSIGLLGSPSEQAKHILSLPDLRVEFAKGHIDLDEFEGATEMALRANTNHIFVGEKQFSSPINMLPDDTCTFSYELKAKSNLSVAAYRIYVAMERR